MLINVWNLRFLREESMGVGPAQIEAELSITPKNDTSNGRIFGIIKNLGDQPLVNLRIRTAQGVSANAPNDLTRAPIVAQLPARSSVRIDAALDGDTANWIPNNQYNAYGASHSADITALWAVACDVAARRSQRIDTLIASRNYACIYAQCEGVAPPAALRETGALQRHVRLVRAVVPLGKAAPGESNSP
jgi:hypothetical protein